MRIAPAAERQARHVLVDGLAQLPRMFHASRRSHRPVAAEHDQRPEALLPGALGVRQAELHRVLRRQERHDVVARHVGAQIDDEMAQVVFFARADRAVGQEHERLIAHEAADRVVGVDPGVHAGGGVEFGARRAQLDGHDVAARVERAHQRPIRAQGAFRQYRQWGRYHAFLMATALAALMSLPAVPLATQPSPVHELTRLPAAVGGPHHAARVREARRSAVVRPRRQQGAEDAGGGGRGAGAGRRRAHHVRRRAIESRARHGRGRRGARPEGRARRERPAAAHAHRQRPARRAVWRRRAVTSRAARSAIRRCRRSPTSCARAGRRPFVVPLGASTRDRRARFRQRRRRSRGCRPQTRRHHPLVVVGRHAGGPHRRLRAARPAGARDRHQRR